jgi:hypothetical protein
VDADHSTSCLISSVSLPSSRALAHPAASAWPPGVSGPSCSAGSGDRRSPQGSEDVDLVIQRQPDHQPITRGAHGGDVAVDGRGGATRASLLSRGGQVGDRGSAPGAVAGHGAVADPDDCFDLWPSDGGDGPPFPVGVELHGPDWTVSPRRLSSDVVQPDTLRHTTLRSSLTSESTRRSSSWRAAGLVVARRI